MGGTRSSHLPLDRKSVLNIISFRSSMPARRDVGNAGGGKLLQLRSRCLLENIFLSLSLFISRFFIHFHRLTVFIITAHFAFLHFSHEFFVASFYTFGPLPLADGEQRQRRRRQRDGVERQLWVPLSEFAAYRVRFTNDDNRRALVRGKCGGVGAWKATDKLPSPSLSQSHTNTNTHTRTQRHVHRLT